MNSKNKQSRPVLLVGGGTGGHIFPLVAIGEELVTKKVPFIYVGEKGGREEKIISELGWEFSAISAGKLRRYITFDTVIKNIRDFFRTIHGFFQAIQLISKTKARAVFSKGGYVALPMVYAAWIMRKPLYIHESDAVMGLTNKVSVSLANKVFTAFAPAVFQNSDQRFIQVGIPVRRTLRQAATLRHPKKTRPLILILGGIQGSMMINSYIRSNVEALTNLADVIHVTGDRDYQTHQQFHAKLDNKLQKVYRPFAFLDRELAYYFQLADLVISRASATTLAEGALFGKAMYVIPLPTAAGNHQVINAKILEREHAVFLRQEYQLSSESFKSSVVELLNDQDQMSRLGRSLQSYFYNDKGIEIIINEILHA